MDTYNHFSGPSSGPQIQQQADAALQKARYWKAKWESLGKPPITEPQVRNAREDRDRLGHELRALEKSRPYQSLRFEWSNLQCAWERSKTFERRFGNRAPGYALAWCYIGLWGVLGWALIAVPIIATSGRNHALLWGAVFGFGLSSFLAALVLLPSWPTEARLARYPQVKARWAVESARVDNLRAQYSLACQKFDRLNEPWMAEQNYRNALAQHQELQDLLQSRRFRIVNTDWRSLAGTPFENFLENVFLELGYQVQTTKASGDQGADLIVSGKGRKVAVQAKGYQGSVGNHAVMEVMAGMVYYGCSSCAVITNSHFTRKAIELAHSTNCLLVDGSQLPNLILGKIL